MLTMREVFIMIIVQTKNIARLTGDVIMKMKAFFLSLCSSGDALCQYFSDSYPADMWCPPP